MSIVWSTAPQGTDEWLASRRGVITGSRAKDARERLADKPEKIDRKTGEVTPAQRGAPSAKALGYAMDLARERCGGSPPPVFTNAAMRTGTEQEPMARAAYEDATGRLVEEVGFACTEDGLFGCSVDGLVDDDGMVEIKTMVSSVTLFEAMVDGDLSAYLDQVQFALWLLGRRWCDLCLWAPDLPAGNLSIIRIQRDEDYIEAMESDLVAFGRLVAEYEDKLRLLVAGHPTAPPRSDAPQVEMTPAPTTTPAPAEVAEANF